MSPTDKNENTAVQFITPTENDVDCIAKIESECFGAAAWSKSSVTDFIKNRYSHVIAAVVDGVIVGYAGAFVICGEAEISNVAVLPGYRRRGIAASMLHRLYDVAVEAGAECIMLEVRDGNVAARSLYEAEGFVNVGVRRGYYSSPREDAILMTKFFEAK